MTEVSRSFEFSVHFQRSLLHRIVHDRKFAVEAIPVIDTESFDTEALKWICSKLKDGYRTMATLIAELKADKKINADIRAAIKSDLKGFFGQPEDDDSDYALQRLKEFVDKQFISTVLLEAANKIEANANVEEIREIVGRAVFSGNANKNVTVDLFETYKTRFTERDEVVRSGNLVYVSSGFKNIDDDIKGPRLGQFWVYFGDTNIGKSQAAVGVGCANVIKGFRVLHFSIEDLLDITLQRYDSRLTRVLYDDLTMSSLTNAEKERVEKIYELLKERRKSHIYVSKIEEGCSAAEIYAEYKRLQNRYGFKPNVIVLDSPADMDPVKQQENFRLGQRQIYRELRRFCQRERVALIAFDQSRQEVKGKIADTNAASESYAKARIVDGFITMNQTKLQKKDGIIELFSAKMKDRPKHRSYLQRPNYKICSFTSIERRNDGA